MLRADKLIQEVRIAESFIEQVDVGPQGKARVGVPKPLLHLLDVLPAAEEERRARVPECGSSPTVSREPSLHVITTDLPGG
jgi:hypothetical protein